MQIADIVAEQAPSGATILDLTPPEAGLYSRIGPPRRAPEQGAEPTVVLQTLPGGSLEVGTDVLAHVLVCERVEVVSEEGLLDAAWRAGWELRSAHMTTHKTYRFAVVLRRADGREHLRVLNEYRYDKLLLRVREEQLERLQDRLARAELRAARQQEELTRQARAEVAAVEERLVRERDALAQARAEVAQRSQELGAARAELLELGARLREAVQALAKARQTSGILRQRLLALEPELAETRKRLARARGAISFRLGRATKVALRDGGSSPLAVIRLWVSTFREQE